VLDEWYHRNESFAECSFMSVLLEMGTDHPVAKRVCAISQHPGIVARRAAAPRTDHPKTSRSRSPS